jgi:putative transposase
MVQPEGDFLSFWKGSKKHTPEQIVAKLRDADVILSTGKDLAAVLQRLEVCEQTYHR